MQSGRQIPPSYRFEPRRSIHAIDVDHVDFVLSPEEIGERLGRLSDHPFISSKASKKGKSSGQLSGDLYNRIFQLLKHSDGVDFTQYKNSTLQRRINRRMVLHRLESLPAYLKLLKKDEGEQKALHNDILINVTSFFRDPQLFESLKARFSDLLKGTKSRRDPLRIWVAGCSTGEEVYSIAICFLELLREHELSIPIQIFATDLSDSCIETARAARYSEGIRLRVSSERLQQFFTESQGTYRVNKSVRDLCIFAKHDVTRDAPFSRMDLISCRNVLIYLQPELQKQVLSTLAYALKPKGLLFLGNSDSTGALREHFTTVAKGSSLYSLKSGVVRAKPSVFSTPRGAVPINRASPGAPSSYDDLIDREIDRIIVSQIAPCSVAVNDSAEILRFRGDTSPFLFNPSGKVSQNLFKMAREGLSFELRAAIDRARKKDSIVVREGLKLKSGKKGEPRSEASSARIRELTRELTSTREYLEALNRDLEGANQELQSANEEVISGNEELQSTNEEIETAKEELQSTNEELATVNDELQSRNVDLDRLSNDLLNFIGSVEIPILMIDRNGRIRRFTPKFEKMLNLIPSDIGRPISDFRSHFEALNIDVDLSKLAATVVRTGAPMETEVQDRDGHWYRLQVRPYQTQDGKTDGAVLALIDIDVLKSSMGEIEVARKRGDRALASAEAGNRAKDVFLAMLSHELRTPLTTILSFVEMLLLKKLEGPKAQRGLEMIHQSALAQAQLINDLLDVSRIIMGKLELDSKEFNPADVLQISIDSVIPLAEGKRITIETRIAPDALRIAGDPVRLKQIFWNLLGNAIKFSQRGGRILAELGLDETSSHVQIRITDSGKGIRADFLPQIFDRFSQADSSSTRAHGGMGLGLAIVRNLAELMQGSVRAESKGEGQGATFVLQFPVRGKAARGKAGVSVVDDSSTERRVGLPDKAATLKGFKILLVDDDAGTREALTLVLASFGAQVIAAESATEALESMAMVPPDVLVSNIAMPGEDGYSLIRRVRTHIREKIKNVPAIALSAYAAKRDIERTLEAGFDRHLSKPIGALQLVGQLMELKKKGRTH